RKPLGLLHHDFLIESLIGDFRVACPYRALGCDFIGPLNILCGHKKACVFDPKDLPPAIQKHAMELLTNASARVLQEISSAGSSETPIKNSFEHNSITNDFDEDDDLPAIKPPSLLLRLYQQSDPQRRDLLCSFLEKPLVLPLKGKQAKRGKSKYSGFI
ncbi:unnamed protein product, partial [Protopolystoma xenopodis]